MPGGKQNPHSFSLMNLFAVFLMFPVTILSFKAYAFLNEGQKVIAGVNTILSPGRIERIGTTVDSLALIFGDEQREKLIEIFGLALNALRVLDAREENADETILQQAMNTILLAAREIEAIARTFEDGNTSREIVRVAALLREMLQEVRDAPSILRGLMKNESLFRLTRTGSHPPRDATTRVNHGTQHPPSEEPEEPRCYPDELDDVKINL
ncbi:MAG: hypothetical protein LBK29_03610 [Oscillospiraceae bacterium]|jgi:hypothetical protein|nr:hypothetical protein [Oscillospiraceae bacterium]